MKFIIMTENAKFLFQTDEEDYKHALDCFETDQILTIDGITLPCSSILMIATKEGLDKSSKIFEKETGKKCNQCEEDDEDDEEDKPLFMSPSIQQFFDALIKSVQEDGKKKG